jgi:hypothetical protein
MFCIIGTRPRMTDLFQGSPLLRPWGVPLFIPEPFPRAAAPQDTDSQQTLTGDRRALVVWAATSVMSLVVAANY